jgi:hypothetical protein
MKINHIHINFCCISFLIIITLVLAYSMYNKTVEGLDSDLSDPSISFCKAFEGNSAQLETACGGLTTDNCKNSNCCVWANGNKCSAGGVTGPTYKTDADGKPITVDNFFYMNKCYGNGCPN